MEYDILMVGAGLSAATFCAVLKKSFKILVLDIRNHIGGNCYDYPDRGSYIHQYGPHIFHSPNQSIVDFLSNYTEWNPSTFQFEAEIEYNDKLVVTPFPYSQLTHKTLGKELTEQEVIDLYFRGYSQKMWGYTWEDLPNVIKGRVPKDTAEKPEYYPNQFVGFPKNGYTRMMENMFDGVDVRLNVGPDEWKQIKAKTVIYMGRPDLLIPEANLRLDFRTLDMNFVQDTSKNKGIRNFCHLKVPYTRKIWHGKLTGGDSDICSTETPRAATHDELTPYYPMQFNGNPERYESIQKAIKQKYPHLILTGRLGSYKYLDMYQVIGQSLAFAKSNFSTKSLL